MEPEQQITAEAILRRQPVSRVPDIPPTTLLLDHTAAAVTISEAIRRRFAQSPDAGVLKRLANVVLEPPNPFNPNTGRQPKQGAVILAALIFAVLGLAFYFNNTAAAR
jgi:hypothetical protein